MYVLYTASQMAHCKDCMHWSDVALRLDSVYAVRAAVACNFSCADKEKQETCVYLPVTMTLFTEVSCWINLSSTDLSCSPLKSL